MNAEVLPMAVLLAWMSLGILLSIAMGRGGIHPPPGAANSGPLQQAFVHDRRRRDRGPGARQEDIVMEHSVSSVTPDGQAYWMLDRCPGCGHGYLYTVSDGTRTNLLCRNCRRCWAVGMGWVHRVDPRACPGCEWRPTCEGRWDCRT